jgi:prepilin peptidase CpaA
MLVSLCALLATAVRSDLLAHRIPNAFTGLGLAAGLVLQSTLSGWSGVRTGLSGAALGGAVFLPLYFLRAMGAGDVKLAGAAGSFLGPAGALVGAVLSLVAGAFCALIWVLVGRRRVVRDPEAPSARELRKQKFPYALAIAIGMLTAAATKPGWAT